MSIAIYRKVVSSYQDGRIQDGRIVVRSYRRTVVSSYGLIVVRSYRYTVVSSYDRIVVQT